MVLVGQTTNLAHRTMTFFSFYTTNLEIVLEEVGFGDSGFGDNEIFIQRISRYFFVLNTKENAY